MVVSENNPTYNSTNHEYVLKCQSVGWFTTLVKYKMFLQFLGGLVMTVHSAWWLSPYVSNRFSMRPS